MSEFGAKHFAHYIGNNRWSTLCGNHSTNRTIQPSAVTCKDCIAKSPMIAERKKRAQDTVRSEVTRRAIDAELPKGHWAMKEGD